MKLADLVPGVAYAAGSKQRYERDGWFSDRVIVLSTEKWGQGYGGTVDNTLIEPFSPRKTYRKTGIAVAEKRGSHWIPVLVQPQQILAPLDEGEAHRAEADRIEREAAVAAENARELRDARVEAVVVRLNALDVLTGSHVIDHGHSGIGLALVALERLLDLAEKA